MLSFSFGSQFQQKLFDLFSMNIEKFVNIENFNAPIHILPVPVQIGNKVLSARGTILINETITAGMKPHKNVKKEVLPFGTGLHWQINQSSWWERKEQVTLSNIRLVPVIGNEEFFISKILPIHPAETFKVRLTDDGAMEVAIWADSKYEKVESQTSLNIPKKDHEWKFIRFESSECVVFEDDVSAVVTFNQQLVKTAWLISHQKKRERRVEKYLVVLKKSDS